MSVPRKYPTSAVRQFFLVLCIIALSLLVIGPVSASTEKVQSQITIGSDPETPSINESFHVVGLLTTSGGKPLGNKRVTLESSMKGADDEAGFEFIGIKVTDRNGGYEFFRPIDSPPEYLRVKFAGNDEYQPVISSVLPVRGVGTSQAQVRENVTGAIMVYTQPQGVEIYVDDIYRGITPLKVADLSEGNHNLVASKSGYQNQTMEAFVTAKIDASFDITMKR